MKLGLGTIVYEFAGLPLYDTAERMAHYGIRYADVLAMGEYNPALLPEKEQEKIAEKFEELEIKASSIVTCALGNLATDDPDERKSCLEELKDAAKLVNRLKGKQVLVGKGAGNIDFNLSREKAWKNSVDALKEYCDWCGERGILVTLELEPEGLHVLNGCESMKRMIEEVNAPNLFANIDIGHLNILREGTDKLKPLKDKIIHVHISDNNGLAHTNCVIGEGNCDINWYIKALIELGVEENAKKQGVEFVAGIEVGEPGEYIQDADNRVLKSLGNVLYRVPHFRNN